MSNERRPFLPRANRQAITREPDNGGPYTGAFPDTLGYTQQGGGKVPADLEWKSCPKQWQEELTETALSAAVPAVPRLPLPRKELAAGDVAPAQDQVPGQLRQP